MSDIWSWLSQQAANAAQPEQGTPFFRGVTQDATQAMNQPQPQMAGNSAPDAGGIQGLLAQLIPNFPGNPSGFTGGSLPPDAPQGQQSPQGFNAVSRLGLPQQGDEIQQGYDKMNQGQSAMANAYGTPAPQQVHPAWRTQDALRIGLPMLLAGLFGGRESGHIASGLLGGYIQGKENKAQADTAYLQNEHQRQMQQRMAQAQSLIGQGQNQVKAGEFNREDATKRFGIETGYAGKRYAADATVSRAQVMADARQHAAILSQGGRDAAVAVQLINNGGPQEKQTGYQMLRKVAPGAEQLTDDQIEAASQLLNPKQMLQGSQANLADTRAGDIVATQPGRIARTDAQTGLIGSQTTGQNLKNTYDQKTMDARVNGAKYQAALLKSRGALTDEEAQLVAEKAKYYGPDLQSKFAERTAHIARLSRDVQSGKLDPFKGVQQMRKGLDSIVSVNQAQQKAILSRYKNALPVYSPSDPQSQESDDASRLQILQHEQENLKKQYQKLQTEEAKMTPKQAQPGEVAPASVIGGNVTIGASAPPQAHPMTGSLGALQGPAVRTTKTGRKYKVIG